MAGAFLQRHPVVLPGGVAALMLLAALGQWPYGYYTLLRFVTCGVAAYVAVLAHERQRIGLTWLFGFVAVLFNPIIPIHLSREIWQPIDVVTAVLFVAAAFVVREKATN